MGLVLDSSVLIPAERGRFDMEAFISNEAPMDPLYIATITASELLHGVHRAIPERLAKRSAFVEAIIEDTPSLPFDIPTARKHAEIWERLESIGQVIGAYDLIIAATCLRYSHRLATLNEREFERITELEIADARPYTKG